MSTFVEKLQITLKSSFIKKKLYIDCCYDTFCATFQPENLYLLSPTSEELKLIDFGFARRFNTARQLRVKYATPEFTSPEVARDDVVTPASDMWSVGVIAHVL